MMVAMRISEKRSRRLIGVDGCKSGWVVAVIEDGKLNIENLESIDEIVLKYPDFDAFLIDMPIGLAESVDDKRPDGVARKVLRSRASTIFTVPSRDAVVLHEDSKEAQRAANKKAIGKSLAEQSLGILKKIHEVDAFFTEHLEYKNRIYESHPEICFSMLKGSLVRSKKKEKAGFDERFAILAEFLSAENMEQVSGFLRGFKTSEGNMDDVLDAVCLAVAAGSVAEGTYEQIFDMADGLLEAPVDNNGLAMRIVAPRKVIARTERAYISVWTEMDRPYANLLWGDPRVTEFICARGKFSKKQIEDRLALEIANYQKYGVQYFPVFRNDGVLIGCCGLKPNEEFGYEFGIHLRPEFWRQGYGLELGEAMKAYASDMLGEKTFFAGHNPKNERSRKFLPKLGFEFVREEFYAPTGLWHPSYVVEF